MSQGTTNTKRKTLFTLDDGLCRLLSHQACMKMQCYFINLYVNRQILFISQVSFEREAWARCVV